MARQGEVPAGAARQGGVPAGAARQGGVPAGAARQGGVPAGAARQGGVPAGAARQGEALTAVGRQEEAAAGAVPGGAVGQGEVRSGAVGQRAAGAVGRAREGPREKPGGDRRAAVRAGARSGQRVGRAGPCPAGIRRARSSAPRVPGEAPLRAWSTDLTGIARASFRLILISRKLGRVRREAVAAVVSGSLAAELPCRQVVDRWRQRIYTAASRQDIIGEVGMSGGFCHIVLRLVETGYQATVQRCTDEHLTGSIPLRGQHIDKTDGV